jgi:anti-sigma B factor antagonist
MNIAEQERDGISVFELEGRIDTQGAEEMDRALQAAIAEGKHKMILDLSAVNYISSAGLRTLADVLTQNREHEGDLKLVGLNQKVLRVLHIIGFDKFFAIYEATDAALADF